MGEAEREAAAAARECDDLKDELCSAKMSVAMLSAEVDELKMSTRQRKVAASDLAAGGAPATPEGAAPPPRPTSGWFSSKK